VLGPIPCVAGIAAFSIVPLVPTASVVEGVDLTVADGFYAGLVVWAALEVTKPGASRLPASALSGTPVLVFLALAGMSLLYVLAVDAAGLAGSTVSWLRLVQTVSIAFLGALFLRSSRDVRLLLIVIAIAGVAAVVLGLSEDIGADGSEPLEGRAGGAVGPNALGLIAGVLLLMAFLGALGPQLLYRIPLAAVGVVGLVESESVGSIVGTSVAVTLGVVFMRPHRDSVPALRAAKGVTALLLAFGLAFGVASVVRPENLPTSDQFEESSTWHRAVVGVAGLEIAARNPIVGVGWRRSSDPDVIGDPELNTELRSRFETTKAGVFPDVHPTSVHNTYVQIAAELGLIGLALLAFVLWTFGKDVRRALRNLDHRGAVRRALWFLAWAVVLVLIWLNDNPLFGGHPETVLLAVLVAAIAGLGRPRTA
jgi:O-antigen ligase